MPFPGWRKSQSTTATLAFGLACSVAGSLLFGLIAVLQMRHPRQDPQRARREHKP